MFSTEFNGYNKLEVEQFITNIKENYEKSLMEEKLKVLEAERDLLEMKKKSQEVEARQKNIIMMIENFKKHQAEGNRNIEVLRGEQLRMIYVQLTDFLTKLQDKDPGLLLNSNYRKLLTEIESILDHAESQREEVISAGTENDPMRLLLSKMQGKRVQESPREVRIERAVDREKTSLIKPVTQLQLEASDEYDNLVDKFLDTKPPEEQPRALKIQSNGFDLKEAINPKDDLSEIMKAFDFYTDNNDEE